MSDDIVMHPQVLDQVAEGDMIATRLRSGALTSGGDRRLGHRLAREAAMMVLTDDNLAASRLARGAARHGRILPGVAHSQVVTG